MIQEALFEKWYALVGFAAFLILLPLALTSTRWSMKKPGKKWTVLHKWVYLAAGLAVLHYILLVKNAYTQPLTFALILVVLLAFRIGPIKQWVIRQRRQWGKGNGVGVGQFVKDNAFHDGASGSGLRQAQASGVTICHLATSDYYCL
ncbi:MAG: hypothetical protein M5U34_40685 [Chloroflexi bacterium]|nr:hypothetical protein [Chloroflexota bacterium]